MTETIDLLPVDRVQMTMLYENLVDMMAAGGGPVERLGQRQAILVCYV